MPCWSIYFCICVFPRRPSFSPDGALLISPTGIHRSVTPFSTQPGTSWPVTIAAPSQSNSTPLVAHTQSYCTHVYSRQSMFPSKESTHTQCTTSSVPPGASSDKGVSTPLASTGLTPIYSLAGLEEPSVAVRCSPILYELIPNHPPLLSGKYRYHTSSTDGYSLCMIGLECVGVWVLCSW